jgi:hypothetical protein
MQTKSKGGILDHIEPNYTKHVDEDGCGCRICYWNRNHPIEGDVIDSDKGESFTIIKVYKVRPRPWTEKCNNYFCQYINGDSNGDFFTTSPGLLEEQLGRGWKKLRKR